MSTMTYREQLLHPNWQRRRLEILNLSEFACVQCGATDKTLHVHHKRYIKGRMAWDYSDAELTCLCERCHRETHDAQSCVEEELALCGSELPRVHAVLLGWRNAILREHEPPDPSWVDGALFEGQWRGYLYGRLLSALDDKSLEEVQQLLDQLGGHAP